LILRADWGKVPVELVVVLVVVEDALELEEKEEELLDSVVEMD